MAARTKSTKCPWGNFESEEQKSILLHAYSYLQPGAFTLQGVFSNTIIPRGSLVQLIASSFAVEAWWSPKKRGSDLSERAQLKGG